MENKKGFTLIELLGVIVILAVIALIAIPVTINIISNSRENAHKRSIENYARQAEQVYVSAKVDSTKSVPNTIEDLEKLINTSGEKVKCDILNITDDGIELMECRVVDEEGKDKSHHYNYIDGKLEKVKTDNQTTYAVYKVGDEITDKINNESYYVILESGQNHDYVVALKAEPLTVSEVNTYGNGFINKRSFEGRYVSSSARDVNGYGGIFYYTNHSGNSTYSCGYDYYENKRVYYDGCKNDYDSSDAKYVVNKWSADKFQHNELKEIDGYSARLIKEEEIELKDYHYCTQYQGCLDTKRFAHDWISNNNYAYWTMTKVAERSVKTIGSNGVFHENTVLNEGMVVRPVINLRKEYIK